MSIDEGAPPVRRPGVHRVSLKPNLYRVSRPNQLLATHQPKCSCHLAPCQDVDDDYTEDCVCGLPSDAWQGRDDEGRGWHVDRLCRERLAKESA